MNPQKGNCLFMKESANKYDCLVSIIVPVYNTKNELPRCLSSILMQTYFNLEILLVDDGSTDGSGQICDEYATNDKRIRVIHKTNGGAASARNVGLDYAKGDYIGFVDSDDFIDLNMYQSMLDNCINNKCDIAFCGRYDVDGEKKSIGLCPKEKRIYDRYEAINKLFAWDEIDSSQCDKLFKKELWKELRFPVGRVCEDVAVIYKVILNATRIISVPIPYYNYVHRIHSASDDSFSPRIFDFSYQTKTILDYITTNNIKEIYDSAISFRIASIIFTIKYICSVSNRDYRTHKNVFNSFKEELRLYFINKEKPTIVKRYLNNTLRFVYYRRRIKSFLKKLISRFV